MAALDKMVSHGVGAVIGFVTGLISSPIIAAWYTYQTTKARGWNFSFIFSVASFIPRLLVNCLFMPFLTAGAGFFHGIRSGFTAACLWPIRCLSIISRLDQDSNLLNSLFPITVPAAVPASVVPSSLPLIASLTSNLEESEEEEEKEEKEEEEIKEEKEEKDYKEEDDSQTRKTYNFEADVTTWTADQLRALAKELKAGKYKILSFHRNQLHALTPDCITALMETINKSDIEVLYLNENNIGQWSAEQRTAFTNGLVLAKKLKTLYLSSNKLDASAEAFAALIQAIVNTNIETLDLSNNNLSAFSYGQMTSILAVLTKSNVTALFLDNNSLGQWTIAQLIQFIEGLQLQHIDISNNNLQNATNQWQDKYIKEFLNRLNFMSYVNLEKNNFSNAQQALFKGENVSNISARRHAFLMGISPGTSKLREEKFSMAPPSIHSFFFNDPMGQKGAIELTKEIFNYLPKLQIGF